MSVVMRGRRSLARRVGPFAAALVLVACIPAPPRVASVPATGLALRVHVFGASAKEVNDAFIAAHKNTPAFKAVTDGGDGDVVLGLENDSPMCVPPTGLCSFKVSYRIRTNGGDAVAGATTTITAASDQCQNLCAQAINNVVVKVIADAAGALASGTPEVDDGAARSAAKGRVTAKPPPPICSIAAGPHLPTEDAEARAAQVEVLKRLGLLDQTEYDCLRKAYLSRL